MVKFLLIIVGWFLLIACPSFGQETIPTSVRNSTTTNIEMQIVVLLEKVKAEIDFCNKNLGLSFEEIDVSKVGATGGYDLPGVNIVTHGLIASKFEWYGDLSKAAEHYYRDYLAETNPKKYWKSNHGWSSPGDSVPFPIFIHTLQRNNDYQTILKVYPEYFDYYFLGHRYKGSKKEKIKMLKEQMKYDPELKSDYNNFMKEWDQTKKLAKTVKPKPLDPAVQHHEWFYSDKQEEVLKALEYYRVNKVKFMLEKALAHKDPEVASKAKEHLENLRIGEKDEAENKKP